MIERINEMLAELENAGQKSGHPSFGRNLIKKTSSS